MTVYKSKIGWGIVAAIVASFGIPGYFLIQDFSWITTLILVVTAGAIFYFFTRIRYEVNDAELKVYGDLISSAPIDISSIRSIKETNNPIASPAASLDRLEITHGKFASKVLVSPKDKAGFIKHILSINPNVNVVYRTKARPSQVDT
ncbi:MAG: PH domain-containing protein [Calditrichia bacterium]